MYLNQNAPPPLVLPAVDLLYSVQQQRNVSLYLPKNNPNEYTIGGVLSGNSGIDQHFIQTLSVSIQIPNTTTTNKCTVETHKNYERQPRSKFVHSVYKNIYIKE